MVRFSLRTLAIAVAAIGLGCAALVNANIWVASAVWTATFLLLSLATVLALLADRSRRGFWIGFAVLGWIYVLAGVSPLARPAGLLSTAGIVYAARRMDQDSTGAPTAPDPNFDVAFAYSDLITLSLGPGDSPFLSKIAVLNGAGAPLTETSKCRIDIGQSLVALLVALAGGLFGHFLVTRRAAAAMPA